MHADCVDPDATPVQCTDCNFEQTVRTGRFTRFENTSLWQCKTIGTGTDWSNYHTCGVLPQNNRDWGYATSGDGAAFGLLHGLCSLTQTITGLETGQVYILTYWSAERPARIEAVVPTLTVRVNDVVLVSSMEVPGSFAEHSITFVSADDGTAKLEFENDTPEGETTLSSMHASIFLDKISIHGARNCGSGANCHDTLYVQCPSPLWCIQLLAVILNQGSYLTPMR